MNDKKLGYAILALVTIVAGLTFLYAARLSLTPHHTRIIAFEQIGNLVVDDIVSCRGLTVGTIRKLQPTNKCIYATVEFFQPLTLYANYHILTHDKGMMGARTISIDPGDSTCAIVSVKDTLRGNFFLGVSEMLGLAGKLEQSVREMIPAARTLLTGTGETPSLVEQFGTIAASIDSLSRSLASVASAYDSTLYQQLSSLNNTLADATRLSRRISADGSPSIAEIDAWLTNLDGSIDRLSKMLTKLDKVVNRLSSDENLLWGEVAHDMARNMRQLRQVINEVEMGTVKLRLILSRWR